MRFTPGGIASEAPLFGRTIISDFSDENHRHMVLTDRTGLHRLTIVMPQHPDGHHVAIIPDECWATRVSAVEGFFGKGCPATTSCLNPTVAQRRRLTLMLKALDQRFSTGQPKFALRHIAAAILYPGRDLGRAIEWKSSTERRQTQRLVSTAMHLRQGGYRDLLKGRITGSSASNNLGHPEPKGAARLLRDATI